MSNRDRKIEIMAAVMTEESFENALDMLLQAATQSKLPPSKVLSILREDYLAIIIGEAVWHMMDHDGQTCVDYLFDEYADLYAVGRKLYTDNYNTLVEAFKKNREESNETKH